MCGAIVALCFGLAGSRRAADLSIDNYQPADVVRNPVVIVRGSAEGPEMAIGTSWKEAIRFPVVNHRYVAVVELKPGINMVLLHSGTETMKFRLDYKPMTGPYKVLAVYVTAADERETYYSDNPKDKFPIRQKFDVALKLIQAFTADAMNRAGYGCKTFQLELDKSGKVIVHFVKSPKKGTELRGLEAEAIYSHVADVLAPMFSGTDKWCGLMGFTGYDAAHQKPLGHLALGGGSQALFGGASMRLWPASLKDLPRVFADTTFVDPKSAFEDSGYRKTVWSNVSTAFGATVHELGHTFGLPHSPDPFSVMSRGFDYFSRSFTVVEAPVHDKKEPTSFTPDQLSRWDPIFAACLNYSPWFQPDGNNGAAFKEGSPPTITFEGDDVVIDAPCGIRVAGTENETIPSWFAEYRIGDPPNRLKLSRKDLRSKMKDTKDAFQIVVVDDHGQQVQVEDKL